MRTLCVRGCDVKDVRVCLSTYCSLYSKGVKGVKGVMGSEHVRGCDVTDVCISFEVLLPVSRGCDVVKACFVLVDVI